MHLATGISSGPSAYWYTTRSTGLVATGLLTASMVLGILLTVRFTSRRMPRFVTAALHRNVSVLAVVFLVVHVLTAELDSYAPVGWLAVVIPFASPYRALWLGLGTVASDIMVAVAITSAVRLRIGYHVWRWVHWSSYACWPIAIVHGFGTGTDSRLTPTLAINAACVAAVGLALGWRLTHGWPAYAPLRVGSAVLTVALPVTGIFWLAQGPLAPGWARRAGTPSRLVGHVITTAAAAAAQPKVTAAPGRQPPSAAPTAFPATAFAGTFTGSYSQSVPNAQGAVAERLAGTTTGAVPGVLVVTLDGTPLGNGGLNVTDSQATFGPTGTPALDSGAVFNVQGNDIGVQLGGPDGGLQVTLRLTLSGTSATGTFTAQPGTGQ